MRRLTLEERVLKKSLIRRKEADAKRRKIWSLIVRKEIPRVGIFALPIPVQSTYSKFMGTSSLSFEKHSLKSLSMK